MLQLSLTEKMLQNTEHDINCKNSAGIDDFLVAPFADDLLRKKLLQWNRRASVNPLIFTKQQGQQYQQYQQQTDNNSMGEQIDKVISSLNTFKQRIRY
jgi:hypothetical protein